jgi:hypothetical protein
VEVPDHTAGTATGIAQPAATLTPLVVGGLAAGSSNCPGTLRAIAILNRAPSAADKGVLKDLGTLYHSITLAA